MTAGQGGPLSIGVAPANVQDCKLLRATIEAIVVERPAPSQEHPHQLCLDKAYDNPTSQEALADQNYISPIRRIGEQPPPPGERKYPARRWVVERTIAWLSKCRAILVRYDKKPQNYLGLLQLACALLWYRRLVAASDTS